MTGTNRKPRRIVLGLCAVATLGSAAEPVLSAASAPGSVVVTNYLVVTNVVVVTNYVVATNVVLTTNALPVAQVKAPSVSTNDWGPPLEVGFDWIQLKSGEWLKGKLLAMQDGKLDFDSEELKDLTFDWKDIRQVRSARWNNLLFTDQERASGPVTITPQEVTVLGAEPRTWPRDELQSIAPGGSRELDYWSGRFSVGLTLRAGNSRSVDFNAQAYLQRRTPTTRFKLDYIGNYNSSEGVESANDNRVNTEFDLWLSKRFYLIIPSGEYFMDPFQNIADQVTVGAGVGYDLIDRSKLEWTISTGPAYQQTWFSSVEPGASETVGAAAWTLGSRFDWELTRRVELILQYRGQLTSRDTGRTSHHSISTLEFKLTKRFDLDLSLVWDWTQYPTPESNGVVPNQNDFRLVLGLGARF